MACIDHYAALKIAPAATAEEVRSAWRVARARLHPDRPTGDAAGFRAAREAFEVLSDPHRRERYDAGPLAWIDDLMRPQRRGEDVLETLSIPVMLSIHGGAVERRGLVVRVPAGVPAGARLRIQGRGRPGEPPGDLLLEVEVETGGPVWRVGDDVHLRLAVTWAEALRRGRFRMPTPWGPVETTLPPSVARGGAELEILGHGARSEARPWGRLVAHVELVPPRAEPGILAFLALQTSSGVRAELEAALTAGVAT